MIENNNEKQQSIAEDMADNYIGDYLKNTYPEHKKMYIEAIELAYKAGYKAGGKND